MQENQKSDILSKIYFPHDSIRNIQDKLVKLTYQSLKYKKNLIAHAPTGLGKTAATLAPALTYAIENKKTIFFLTSRHTQHKIAVDTLRQIKKKHDLDFSVVDIVGKKWMCPQPGIDVLYSGEFSEYCKAVREEGKCEFYNNTKNSSNKLTFKAQAAINDIKNHNMEELMEYCTKEKFCPYEMSVSLARDATVIICDYYYIFNPKIRDMFFSKIGKELEDIILIIDEAHNLPFRVRDLMTQKLSNQIIKRALKEADKFGFDHMTEHLLVLENTLRYLAKEFLPNIKNEEFKKTPFQLNLERKRSKEGIKSLDFFSPKQEEEHKNENEQNNNQNNTFNNFNSKEKIVSKEEFMVHFRKYIKHYDQLIGDLEHLADEVRGDQKSSYLGSISKFLENWDGEDYGYTRIISVTPGKKEPTISLSYRCLDPSIICKNVVNSTYSTIIMSGTLIPIDMYRDLIGLENCNEVIFDSPFPQKNRENIIIPDTTTKYSQRSEEQFKKISQICSNICNSVPGNSAIFFPSYKIRDLVNTYFSKECRKSIFTEAPGMTKTEKVEMLENFKGYKNTGAVLLAASSGSFGEGVDFKGDFLKSVIVVGLPLNQPDLETKEMINYFDKKFGKGWDYGYIFPAFNKTLQNAGRCIRSETDKGIIVFLDERYAWPRYLSMFPKELNIKIDSTNYEKIIENFFKI
jgi:DNA excision repair protein ERCC-2